MSVSTTGPEDAKLARVDSDGESLLSPSTTEPTGLDDLSDYAVTKRDIHDNAVHLSSQHVYGVHSLKFLPSVLNLYTREIVLLTEIYL